MVSSVGGAHGDGDGGSNDSVLYPVVDWKGCATTGFGGVTDRDGNGKTSGSAVGSAAAVKDRIETKAI